MTDASEGLDGLTGDEQLAQVWRDGLILNPALPAPVLARLLTGGKLTATAAFWLAHCSLDRDKTAALVASPHSDHRRLVTENPYADVDVLARLARDPEPRVRVAHAASVGDGGRRISEGVLEILAADSEPRVRRAAARLPLPVPVRARLAEDEDASVRAAALTEELWPQLSSAVREALLADPEPQVRDAVAKLLPSNPEPLPEPHLRVQDPDPRVRSRAALDPDVPTALALRLAEDPDDRVRLDLSMREDLTAEQRSSIAYVVPGGYATTPRWIMERGHEPDVARRAAASGHVLLRRGIAGRRHLPADVVDRLAQDEDFFVKLTLCESCQDAPHELVLEMYTHWHGLRWSFLRVHPNFARPGLARFVDHPNPRLRRAALDDPEAGPELVMRLIDDPDAEVARWALRDPRLPTEELHRRLGVPASARDAAANPTLAPETMHRLLDLAGVANPSGTH
ncbi:HEAT repeat domain-containing protein [Streptomyces sp. NPDC020898]|uniref:HEAT repeat domain-containing protein n=1 Tax=Streptomyces sp. NPDC020898 TaxID=3365101 RepID=UPI0037B0CCDD